MGDGTAHQAAAEGDVLLKATADPADAPTSENPVRTTCQTVASDKGAGGEKVELFAENLTDEPKRCSLRCVLRTEDGGTTDLEFSSLVVRGRQQPNMEDYRIHGGPFESIESVSDGDC
jgi:hypothetical protein